MAVVKLEGHTKNVLTVTGLDALNGTPILDIKPYLPGDSVAEIKVPDWVHKLRQPD
jgi:tRNA (Thr-GGU) A37 N-methylase